MKTTPRCLLCLSEVRPVQQANRFSAERTVFTCDGEFSYSLWPYRDDDYIDRTPPCEEEYHHQIDGILAEGSTAVLKYTIARSAAGSAWYGLKTKQRHKNDR